MDSNRYQAFVAAVETSSMSGAAKQLGYTPSGIIRLINSLEAELGFPLLARSSSGVSPTAEGLRMLPMFQQMCKLEEQAQQTGARIRGLAEGTLTIGALSSLASMWLPRVIKEYQQLFPGVRVNIMGGSDIKLLEMLEQHAIDCCLFHGDHSKTNWVPLGKQELVAWLPASSALAKHSSLILAELDGKPFIRIHPEGESFAEQLMRQRNIEPDVRYATNDCFTAWRMVGQGLGFTLCSAGTSNGWSSNGAIAVRPLSPQQFMEVGIATLDANTPAVEEFITVAKRFPL
ncbi:MAG: LysR family transcriptional regulator [Coriobacteriia bacterium]|nr:LysR family transcriptional regulator [Coriobacteriia bacterium]